jgi:hypothetical protein
MDSGWTHKLLILIHIFDDMNFKSAQKPINANVPFPRRLDHRTPMPPKRSAHDGPSNDLAVGSTAAVLTIRLSAAH